MHNLAVDISAGILEAASIRAAIADIDSEFAGFSHVSLVASRDNDWWTLKLMASSGLLHQCDLFGEQQNVHNIQAALLALKGEFLAD